MCPDYDVASGGIRVIYRFVDILNSSGVDAVVVHRSAKFRSSWFENDTTIIGAETARFQKGDLLVIPEWYRQLIPWLAPGVPNVIINQNAYEMFSDVPFEKGAPAPLMNADTIGIIGISEDNLRYFKLCFPGVRVDSIRLSMDTELFHPSPDGKTRTIAYMPRKRLKELNQILHVLDRRGSLDGWELQPIIGVSEVEVARRLGSAAIFLALNDREGIALPSLEAMASGCVVVGFHGGSGEEYMKPDLSVPIPDGEVVLLVESLESEMSRWVEGDESQQQMIKAAVEFVRSTYTQERERDDVVRVFSEALNRVSQITPGTEHLNKKLLAANTDQLNRAIKKLPKS
ncbi:MAG: glycosyltransferase [Acidimicrobiaceae bacterium]|nr:glycosyltransferase [Acidimicrobiaceae bacterium]